MVRRLDKTELEAYARKAGFTLDIRGELEALSAVSDNLLDTLEFFERIEPPWVPTMHATRDPGRRPTPEEDPLNAIVRVCSVRADAGGRLQGKRIGLKDMISIAGVPMTLGSKVMEGYVPDRDSVLVERLLEEGAEIVAILNMDAFFSSASGGETSDYGVIRNPYDVTRTAGGSSGGAGAALHYENIDITFGSDQGGSVRLPASWCGVLGLKPTHGLVPYTGIASLDPKADHVGPLTRSIGEMATALDAVAGKHASDPRQAGEVPTQNYQDVVDGASADLTGVKVGVLREGFEFDEETAPEGTRETMETTRVAIDKIAELGAEIVDVSIPEHSYGPALMFVTFVEGLMATVTGSGNGYHWEGRYSPHFALEFGKALKAFSQDLPPTVKVPMALGMYMREYYFSTFYAKARNLASVVRDAYDRAFDELDFVIMPTATHFAHRHEPNLPLAEHVLRGWDMLNNTAGANVSGHPALSMPAAQADNGLPVGVMVVGKRFHDAEILAFARAYEEKYGWVPA